MAITRDRKGAFSLLTESLTVQVKGAAILERKIGEIVVKCM